MADGIYTALSGGLASLEIVDTLANNLANASAHGYKRDRATFAETLAAASSDGIADSAQVARSGSVVDLSQGALETTRGPLDLALIGEGLFTLQTPAGLRHTRRGDFRRADDGKLVTSSGHEVLGERGPILLPKGEVSVDESGVVSVDRRPVDRLRLESFPGTALTKEAGALFIASGAPQPAKPRVVQGQLEKSNVSAVGTMSALMVASRAFEMSVQMMQSYRRLDEKLTAEMGKNP